MNERTIMKRIYDFGKIARKTPDGHNDLIEFCESQNNKEQTYCYNMIRTYGYRNEMTRQPAPMNTAEYLDSLKDLKKNKNNEKFKEMISYKFCECVGGRLMVKRIRMDFGVVLRQPSPYESCKNTIYYRRRIKVPEDVSYMCSA